MKRGSAFSFLLSLMLALLVPASGYSVTVNYFPGDTNQSIDNGANIEYEYTGIGTSWRIFYSDKCNIDTTMVLNGFKVDIMNKTNLPITVDWSKASIIVGGNAERIVTGETSYASRFNPIPPAFIPPHSIKSTLLIPLKNIIGVNQYGVQIEPLIKWPIKMALLGPSTIDTNKKSSAYKKFITSYDGTRLGLYFPLIVDNIEKIISISYKFDFTEEKNSIARMETIKNQGSGEPVAAERPTIGLTLGEKTKEGFFPILKVESNSKAAIAKLTSGDLITEIDGKSSSEFDQKTLSNYIQEKLSTNGRVILVYLRNEKKDLLVLK